jgi:uroporphyrinogen III methyltransferase / synthase
MNQSNQGKGFVSLVGAGPGDPGLITVKGMACIAQADVIIYDFLANPVLLAHARPDAEILYAGKRAGYHSMVQEDINVLIGEKALEDKRVCRLKGGDPFVFGRGGEEVLHLRSLGVPFEIVPGISSSMAVPTYAGIPVTHRGKSVSVRIITGHEAPGKEESDHNWDEIGTTEGTLVFLMGVRNLPMIREKLIAGGRSPETPAAIIRHGTTPHQRTLVATLDTIAEKAAEEGFKPPCIIIVGEVAALRDEMSWFEERPLFGHSVLVTRATSQASDFAERLSALGAEVIQTPVIRIKSLAKTPEMQEAVQTASAHDWAVFTSVNGVDSFRKALAIAGADVRCLAGVKIAAIGEPTADRLHEIGLNVDLVPKRFVAEGLLEAFDAQGPISEQRFLLPISEIARPLLVNGLKERGAVVNEVAAYTTIHGGPLPREVLDRLEAGEIDVVSFTSSSTVTNFINALPDARRETILERVHGASIGSITSATMKKHGVSIAVTASESTIPGLTDAITAHCAE